MRIRLILPTIIAMGMFSSCDSCVEIAKGLLEETYRGQVSRKYYDSSNRMSPMIIFADGRHRCIDYTIHKSLEEGDSILKRKGTLQHIIFRDTAEIVVSPVCGGIKLEDHRFIRN